MEHGPQGATHAAERGDVLLVVDVLSFATTVAVAVDRGANIIPCITHEEARTVAAQTGTTLAVRREDVPHKGRLSLSPVHMANAQAGEIVAVASANGATCVRYGSASPNPAPVVFVGALVTAQATARAAAYAAAQRQCGITVLACGETHLPGSLEDYVGAGAILYHLVSPLSVTTEAAYCRYDYERVHENGLWRQMVQDSPAGRELRERGFADDVEAALQLNRYDFAVVLHEGHLAKFALPPGSGYNTVA